MIRRHVDRRTAIVAMVATAVLLPVVLERLQSAAAGRPVVNPLAAQWDAPRHWDHLPAANRTIYLTIDRWVYDKEQAGLHHELSTFFAKIAASLDADEVKEFAIFYVRDSKKGLYLDDLLPALDPSLSSTEVRGLLVGSIEQIFLRVGPQSMPPRIRLALQAYRDSGMETDLVTIGALDRLIPELIAAGL